MMCRPTYSSDRLDGSSAIMIFMSDSTARRYLNKVQAGNIGLIGLGITMIGFRYIYPRIEAVVASLLLRGYF